MIENRINGKRYIGITKKDVRTRWRYHVQSAKDNSYYCLHKAIRKYGKTAFEIVELGMAPTWQAACQIEKALIVLFNTFWGNKAGYNQTWGGDGHASSLSQKARQKISDTKKKYIATLSESERRDLFGKQNIGVATFQNRKHTSEALSKMSKAKVKNTFTYNGETLSAFEWSKRTGIKPNTIRTRINTYGWSVERALTTVALTRKRLR